MYFHLKTCCLGYEQNSIDEKFVKTHQKLRLTILQSITISADTALVEAVLGTLVLLLAVLSTLLLLLAV